MKMRSAFTMIELIFVIVIIGILASIAIVKLNATRDDAEVSMIAKHISDASSEIISYAMSQKKIENNILDMSNILQTMVDTNRATVVNNVTINIKLGNVVDCATIKIDNSNINYKTIILDYANDNSDKKCNALKSTIHTIKYPVKLGGYTITR